MDWTKVTTICLESLDNQGKNEEHSDRDNPRIDTSYHQYDVTEFRVVGHTVKPYPPLRMSGYFSISKHQPSFEMC